MLNPLGISFLAPDVDSTTDLFLLQVVKCEEMDFVRRIRKKQCEIRNIESLEHLYQHNIKFYYNPPVRDVTLHMLEDIVVERLKVLHILEKTSGKNVIVNSNVSWKQTVLSEFKSQKLFGYVRLVERDSNDDEAALVLARERDYIAHFVLRFYYCDSDVLRQWFVDREIELFRLKFSSLKPDQIQSFLLANKLNYNPVNIAEIKQIHSEINEFVDHQQINVEDVEFYKIRFIEVLNLVSSRQCILKRGYAYVNQLDSIIETIHRGFIEKGLLSTFRMIKVIKEDQRVAYLLKTIDKLRPGNHSGSSGQTSIESIDSLSTNFFPICARMCHEMLREKHHLKYFARNQYQLFLKGIGVSLEDSLKFWIEEFTHDNKEKPLAAKYRYQIEYNYGKRGSKIDIQPPSCSELIAMNHPSFQQCYGCPYKFLESSNLKAKLIEYGLSSVQTEEVLNYSNKNDYQLACTKHLELVHEYQPNEVINSPNRYFELSQMMIKIRSKEASQKSIKQMSIEESLYDKHLWEMLSPAKENSEKSPLNVDTDFMSQLDLNY